MELNENVVQVIILDISGIYAQIFDQRYVDKNIVDKIREKYSDTQRWRVVIINWQT